MKESLKYVFGAVFFAILFVVLIVGISNTNSGSGQTQKNDKPKILAANYKDSSSSVRLTIEGPIVANEQARAIRMTITPSERRLDILRTYERVVDNSKSYQNTRAAYEAFLFSIDGFGFANEKKIRGEEDMRKVCPTGRKYSFELIDAVAQ